MAWFQLDSLFIFRSDSSSDDKGCQFSGVQEVIIKKSLHSLVQTATIKIPSFYNGGFNTRDRIKEGYEVEIHLGYNGELKEEFRGFVKEIGNDRTLVIQCEGYSYHLRRRKANFNFNSISIKELLERILRGTGINFYCTIDMKINVFRSRKDVYSALLEIKNITDGAVNIFFISPKMLYVGLVYTAYVAKEQSSLLIPNDDTGKLEKPPIVNLFLGYNLVDTNSLKQRTIEDAPKVYIYTNRNTKGEISTGHYGSKHKDAVTVKKFIGHIEGNKSLETIAKENACKRDYLGYQGSVNAFLQPYALPGYTAFLKKRVNKSSIVSSDSSATAGDKKTSGFNNAFSTGYYLIESTEVSFGTNGARRKIELGPKIS